MWAALPEFTNQRRLTMRKYSLFVALFIALASTAVAQEKPTSECKVRVLVAKHDWQSGAVIGQFMSRNQAEWWKDNAKKYPGVCLVDSVPADYVLAWAETSMTVAYTANVPVTTTESGTVRTSDGRTATYSGTSTTTQPQQQQWNHWFVDALIFKLDGGKREA